ncbi:MAG: hypothetical protein GWN01_16025 [Nitrosopumilaceae archaeon]|nr:hypothetical protein [Nitrosopumilaceae archaeon]NIU02345.1 hypothetical protein [Nitrosopumilaceae archaeon]NIU88801.1 hypothetical protein [Nitrosopumilaceae archaeon]NIV66927.1 hypothetical protein [Nitrosopumilaceae archaeon]NIX62946.1 hypothetical protein [Nitrosopumilaceae archaeon]
MVWYKKLGIISGIVIIPIVLVYTVTESTSISDWIKSDVIFTQNLQSKLESLEKENKELRSEIQRLKERNQRLNELYISEANKNTGSSPEGRKYYGNADNVDSRKELDSLTPETIIEDQKIKWRVYDSYGNLYSWQMRIDSYEGLVSSNPPKDYLYFELPNGETAKVLDHTKFVGTSFEKVIDEVYANSEDDSDFIYQVWFIVSQLTTYSYDIGDDPRYALETLSRGGGDCEDTAILIADMLKSSSHTMDWKIQLVYFDSDNIHRPKNVNHVAVSIDTGDFNTIIESTAKTGAAANTWNEKEIFGWWFKV